MEDFSGLHIFHKLARGQHIVVEAFGSSNTQRRLPGMTWFDFVELAFKQHYGGGCGNFINCGIGGDTSSGLLARYQRDLDAYKPDLVIITIGGNDSSTLKNISKAQFKKNLLDLQKRIADMGAEVIFQTYYACMLDQLEQEMADKMLANMQSIREVAKQTASSLQDHYQRWQLLQEQQPELYSMLMLDPMHVNETGNALLGLDLLASLKVPPPASLQHSYKAAFFAQQLINQLARQ
ncbi:MAG: SGNH/GDSL hydrolase family protein [Lentisphaeria bacterium]|jgi:lysophospholipase L1-like esterase|nr:SGNH/GDSL hydrolase family protein [Lentisphaeria bacterium]MDY0176010.1 SGNH/GDSL hydrolase family protein [Lentisphaeria bacterium]NLZ60622.1 SGNH/GDSL hydrolase family protein [Lentisphaerota bacterium]